MSNAQAATGSPRCSVMPRGWFPVAAAPSSCASPKAENAVSLKDVLSEGSPADHLLNRKLKMSLCPIFYPLNPKVRPTSLWESSDHAWSKDYTGKTV
ncbi:hypothetical protein GJAV_G00074560 [Gymnothorax javanicus]|nr:hypothetical protein GJAV_G00074560 [Gymnothorax javanicus]